ncbi:MAG: hypothetical protein QOD51_2642, partial [Candidatus Eremiobacteraeota bacterium]|nr:hypothetical protein [Candidatus Eremiobacteraeota bacterium]
RGAHVSAAAAAVATYDATFAGCYDRLFGSLARLTAPHVVAIHRRMRPEAAPTFADLCCGTGLVASAFLARGYSGIAVDVSPSMLDVARRNLREPLEDGRVRLIESDVLSFQPDAAFSMITCINRVFNQLPSLDDVRGTMRTAARAAAPGGLFLFDLATEAGLVAVNGEVIRDLPDALFIMRSSYDAQERAGRQEATGFYLDDAGGWQRFRFRSPVRALDFAWVRSEMCAAGWSSVRFVAPDFSTVVDAPGDLESVYVLAERGAAAASNGHAG